MMPRALVIALALEAFALAGLLAIALDQYTHAQHEMIDGLNRWGYRGAVARQRAFDERRVVMIGGTRAFQPGVPVRDTTTARLRFMIEQWVTFDRGPVTAVNLGVAGAPRGAYSRRLEQFRYLTPDVICIYADLTPAAPQSSPGMIARSTGYVLAQPALAAIDRRLGMLLGAMPPEPDDAAAISDAVAVAVSMAPGVVVALPEPSSSTETAERDAMLAALTRFSGDPRVTVVQLQDGPPASVAGVVQPADAIQIEPAVSAFFRARMKNAA